MTVGTHSAIWVVQEVLVSVNTDPDGLTGQGISPQRVGDSEAQPQILFHRQQSHGISLEASKFGPLGHGAKPIVTLPFHHLDFSFDVSFLTRFLSVLPPLLNSCLLNVQYLITAQVCVFCTDSSQELVCLHVGCPIRNNVYACA